MRCGIAAKSIGRHTGHALMAPYAVASPRTVPNLLPSRRSQQLAANQCCWPEKCLLTASCNATIRRWTQMIIRLASRRSRPRHPQSDGRGARQRARRAPSGSMSTCVHRGRRSSHCRVCRRRVRHVCARDAGGRFGRAAVSCSRQCERAGCTRAWLLAGSRRMHGHGSWDLRPSTPPQSCRAQPTQFEVSWRRRCDG
jgi:hypothetical protein